MAFGFPFMRRNREEESKNRIEIRRKMQKHRNVCSISSSKFHRKIGWKQTMNGWIIFFSFRLFIFPLKRTNEATRSAKNVSEIDLCANITNAYGSFRCRSRGCLHIRAHTHRVWPFRRMKILHQSHRSLASNGFVWVLTKSFRWKNSVKTNRQTPDDDDFLSLLLPPRGFVNRK